MSNAAKNKGKSFERELAKKLTAIFGLNFERVPSSGAFVGGFNSFRLNKLTKSQALLSTGDLIAPDELSHLAFECKFYKDFSFVSLLDTNKQLDGWIEQASACNKLWFLAVKLNHVTPFVVFDSKYHNSLQIRTPGNYIQYKRYTICTIDGFFEANKDFLLNKRAEILQSCNEQLETTVPTTTGCGPLCS